MRYWRVERKEKPGYFYLPFSSVNQKRTWVALHVTLNKVFGPHLYNEGLEFYNFMQHIKIVFL